MQSIPRRALFVFVVVIVGAANGSAVEPPSVDSPEQMVLDRWLGAWQSDFTYRKSVWNPEEKSNTAKITSRRVLGNRYVEENSGEFDGMSTRLMLTYDPYRNTYRSWWFSSAGYA